MSLITIDGPAGAGKGTLARALAAHYSYGYLDTGALYRAVAAKVLHDNLEPVTAALQLTLADTQRGDLRTPDVTEKASQVAAMPDVRAALLSWQREKAYQPPTGLKGMVLDGRDTGSVVCPDAPAKLFLTASVDERAQRRWLEVQGKPYAPSLDAIKAAIIERDMRDSQRGIAPLLAAHDMYVLDSSQKDAHQVLAEAITYIATRIA